MAAAAALLLFAVLAARQRGAGTQRRHDEELAAAARSAQSERATCEQELSALRTQVQEQKSALALLQSPSTKVVSFAAQPGKGAYSAKALVDVARHAGMVLSASLPRQSGKDYELWILRGKAAPVPAGLLRPHASGELLASIDPQLLASAPDALAISIEQQGGSATGKPSSDIVLVGALSGS